MTTKKSTTSTHHPILLEVNARVLLRACSHLSSDPVTLGTIPDEFLDRWSALHVDIIWLMGVWTSGPLGRQIAIHHRGLREDYSHAVPDWVPEDVGGSPYAVQSYEPPAWMGGWEGLRRIRERLTKRGMRLMLDFVPNHTARDHEWIQKHPEYYVHGNPGEERDHPDLFFLASTSQGDTTLAFGRDPYFSGWTDTAQLNYCNPGLRSAQIIQLHKIADACDAVRCDMAMLVMKDIFAGTWTGRVAAPDGRNGEFWPEAIKSIKATHPDFLFVAEAYWNKEWDLQQMGFDYTYDKVLYDRLLHEGAIAVREHLGADLSYQMKSVRFLENHDEMPAASSMPSASWHFAAATIMATIPGMVLLHDVQLDGCTTKFPVQLTRRSPFVPNEHIRLFYATLFRHVGDPVFRQGSWTRIMPRCAWHDNSTWQDFIVHWWDLKDVGHRLVVVNFSPHSSQCYVNLPLDGFAGPALEFKDLMGASLYLRELQGLKSKGMFFDLPAYGFHVFQVKPVELR